MSSGYLWIPIISNPSGTTQEIEARVMAEGLHLDTINYSDIPMDVWIVGMVNTVAKINFRKQGGSLFGVIGRDNDSQYRYYWLYYNKTTGSKINGGADTPGSYPASPYNFYYNGSTWGIKDIYSAPFFSTEAEQLAAMADGDWSGGGSETVQIPVIWNHYGKAYEASFEIKVIGNSGNS